MLEWREYRCVGFGKTYLVTAQSNWDAQCKAATALKQDVGRGEPVTFLGPFFTTRLVHPKDPGKPSTMAKWQKLAAEGKV